METDEGLRWLRRDRRVQQKNLYNPEGGVLAMPARFKFDPRFSFFLNSVTLGPGKLLMIGVREMDQNRPQISGPQIHISFHVMS